MKSGKEKKNYPSPLPPEGGFSIRCTVEQTDRFESDFLGAYGDMIYDRENVRKKAVATVIICAVLSLFLFLNDGTINLPAYLLAGFGAMYAVYGIYYYRKGYRNDYLRLKETLEDALDRGITVYETESYTYEFRDDAVYFTDANSNTRFFIYDDIRYIEQTGRFYEIGMKYRPREKRLAGLDKVIITKRFLSGEERDRLETLLESVKEIYGIKPVLEDHPFK